MNENSYRRLTARERSILRLVDPRRKTAIIAGEIGLASGTVETHIKRARAKLGGVGRFDAADQLRAYEARTQRLDTQPLGIGEPPPIVGSLSSVDQPVDCGEMADELREERASFAYAPMGVVPRQPVVGRRYGLGAFERFGLIVAMIVGLALTVVAVLTMFGTIDRSLPAGVLTYRIN